MDWARGATGDGVVLLADAVITSEDIVLQLTAPRSVIQRAFNDGRTGRIVIVLGLSRVHATVLDAGGLLQILDRRAALGDFWGDATVRAIFRVEARRQSGAVFPEAAGEALLRRRRVKRRRFTLQQHFL